MNKLWILSLFVIVACNSRDTKTPVADKDTIRVAPEGKITQGPFKAVRLSRGDLPMKIHFDGKFTEGWKWNDKLGINFLVLSTTLPYTDTTAEGSSKIASVHAIHYLSKDGEYEPVSVFDETEGNCEFDITCTFIPGSITITDLNNNGIAETKIQVAKACRSDVSPAYMKLLLRENKDVYTLQGSRWMRFNADIVFDLNENNVNLSKLPKGKDEATNMFRMFGRYANENEFAKAPPGFIEFARREWLKFAKESIDE